MWSLWPPSGATYSKEAAADRWRRVQGGDTTTDRPMQCVQKAGDVLYVPALWGHGTLNQQQSIGVAFEISLEPFCME